MTSFSTPNPKKNIVVDYPVEEIINSVKLIPNFNKKYRLFDSNESFKLYTLEVFEFLSIGVYIDVSLNSTQDQNKSEISVEVRRKIGSFDQSYEIRNANEHISIILKNLSEILDMEPEARDNLKNENNKENLENSGDIEVPKKEQTLIGAIITIALAFLFLIGALTVIIKAIF